MPAKNTEKYIEECLNSIINQSYKNWNLYVVNDHSTDSTVEILQKFAQKDNRIHVLHNQGNGIIDALKTAYLKSEGHYITRMDSDDIMPFYKLKKMTTVCKDNTVVTGKINYISETILGEGYAFYEKWMNQLVDSNSHYAEIYKECVIASPCWMMTKKSFDDIGGGNSEMYPEDYDLVFRMYLNNIKVIPLPDVLHIWRDYSARTSRNDENYSKNSFLLLKAKYFIKINYDKTRELVLWGVGKKGKTLAKLFIERSVKFRWITDNPNRINKTVYGVEIEHQNVILSSENRHQLIILIANRTQQLEIKNRLKLKTNLEAFWFC